MVYLNCVGTFVDDVQAHAVLRVCLDVINKSYYTIKVYHLCNSFGFSKTHCVCTRGAHTNRVIPRKPDN